MYLKSLELQGFKSFPDKTKLTFEKGATVIVGPNGSGKSNISDAMRWVLGEISPKSIRGAKMEDIIFGGTESRKPMGYAEVSVSFDNTGDEGGRLDSPYDEVTVTRRYYRAGESEYFINRKPVRLKDIYELFMNTGIGRDGYSIVGQGKIAEIISQKSDERRGIFEDASGIARYRHKKSEAERKLAATEDNMLRINDILSELEGRVEPLEKEAAKAKKYLELYELKKQADVRLWLYDTEKLRADVAEAEKAYKLSEIELQGAQDALAALEAQNDKLFEAVQSSKMESEDLLAKIREQIDINHALESDFKVGESNIAHTDELIKVAKESILSTEKAVEAEKKAKEERLLRISELEAKAEELRSEQDEKNGEVRKCASDAEKLELDIASALEEIKALENERIDIRVRRSVLENAKSTDTDKNSSIMTELEEYRTVSEQIKKKCEAAKASADKYLSEIDRLDEEAERNAEKTAKLSSRRRELGEEANRARLVRDSLSQRVETLKRMEEHFEGYNTSVRFVMKQYEAGSIRGRDGSACGKIYGPLSKLISVDEKYITAVETSLGANLQNIVVEDEETAKSAIFALKNAGAGRATFYPITSMKASSPTQEVRDAARFSGFVGTADTLVKSDSRFSDIISSILGRTVIFDTIDNASAMAKSLRYRVKAVTLDGQQINPGGSFTGGSAKRDSGILSRAGEIEKLTSELKKAEKDAEKSRQAFEASEKELDVLNSESASIADRRKLIETMMNAENASYDQLAAKLDANNSLIEKLKEDFDTISKLQKQYDEDISSLAAREKELTEHIDGITEYRGDREVEKNGLLDRKNAVSELLTELYIKISETQKDIETERMLYEGSDGRIRALEEETEGARTKIAELEKNKKIYGETQRENRAKAEEGEARLKALSKSREEKEAGGFEFEEKLNRIRAKIREKTNEKELIFRSHTANETKLEQRRAEQDKLSSRLWDDYELTRAGAVELGYPPLTEEERGSVLALQSECRNKLRSLGTVNVGAVEEYAEVKTRYDYMKGQISDLTASKNELTDIINKLEREMKTAFVEAFNAINENFGKTFSELFGGGSAEVIMTDPENVLTSGIEIKAAPPGKIVKSMMQLSGGEQAFVAIALFFAILKVNPTSFCILDEIEAALDEVNVARFGEYIKRYSGDTQFILITHRRGTMEVADRLYGVTMPEHGISKVLELNVSDIKKTEGDDWDGIFRQA